MVTAAVAYVVWRRRSQSAPVVSDDDEDEQDSSDDEDDGSDSVDEANPWRREQRALEEWQQMQKEQDKTWQQPLPKREPDVVEERPQTRII